MVVQAWNPSIERAGEECQPETRRETVSETQNKTRTGNVYQDQDTLPSMCKGLGLSPSTLATATSTTYTGAEGQSKQ